jgi:hypothetical protein
LETENLIEKMHDNLGDALDLFISLSEYKISESTPELQPEMEFLMEGDSVKTRLNKIRLHIALVKRLKEAIGNKTVFALQNLEYWLTDIDGKIWLANNAVLEFVKENKWIDSEAQEYKILYQDLVYAVRSFYNVIVSTLGQSAIRLIPQTKDILGRFIYKDGQPGGSSVTKEPFLSNEQWAKGFNP